MKPSVKKPVVRKPVTSSDPYVVIKSMKKVKPIKIDPDIANIDTPNR